MDDANVVQMSVMQHHQVAGILSRDRELHSVPSADRAKSIIVIALALQKRLERS